MKPFALRPGLAEVPVSTMPLFRVPVHLSYVMFLAARSEALARAYWHVAATLFRLRGIGPSILLHPADYLDSSDAPDGLFPGHEGACRTQDRAGGHGLALPRHALAHRSRGRARHPGTSKHMIFKTRPAPKPHSFNTIP